MQDVKICQGFINKMIHDIRNKISVLMLTAELEEYSEIDNLISEIIRIIELYEAINNKSISWKVLEKYLSDKSLKPRSFHIFLLCCIIHLSSSKYIINIISEDLIEIIGSKVFDPFLMQPELTLIARCYMKNESIGNFKFDSNNIIIDKI